MKKAIKVTYYLLMTIVLLFFAISGALELYPNFHTVIPDKIYRSGQLNTWQFEHYINKYHIKSVLNLRGPSTGKVWYRHEIQAIKQTGIHHYDLGLPAHGLTNVEKMKRLTDIIQTAPKPLLIHCWRGADRTGLGSAIALIIFTEQPLIKIKQQLSWLYGVFTGDSIGIVEIAYYQRWLQKNHLANSKRAYLQWLQQLQSSKDYPGQA